jgi:hypothetical protein
MTNKTESENINQSGGTFCTYLLTIRRARFDSEEAENFKAYFGLLGESGCEVLVVDGSPPEVFAAHAQIWSGVCHHETVDPQYKYLNGKVNGIHTGVDLAAHNRIILADDDIRYTPADARRIADLLAHYDMVRPQNYFRPAPFWARMEAARMLLNRAFISEGDYSGTLGITRNAMLRFGHYDGDVLFDNEEIVRHFRFKGARIKYARDFFIQKLPATFEKWIEQRPRQAYEDFVMHVKTVFFLALPIDLVITGLIAGWEAALIYVLIIAIGSIFATARGLGDGALRYFSPLTIFTLRSGLSSVRSALTGQFYWYFTRGGYPFGDKVVSKGTGRAWTTKEPADD